MDQPIEATDRPTRAMIPEDKPFEVLTSGLGLGRSPGPPKITPGVEPVLGQNADCPKLRLTKDSERSTDVEGRVNQWPIRVVRYRGFSQQSVTGPEIKKTFFPQEKRRGISSPRSLGGRHVCNRGVGRWPSLTP